MIVNNNNRTRKIIGNLIIACIVFPLLYINNSWWNILTKNYFYEYRNYINLYEFLERIFKGVWFFSIILLVGTLLPLQLIKNTYLYNKQKYYFIKSLAVYILINICFLCITGYGSILISNLFSPLTDFLFPMPLIITLIFFSAIVQSCLYLIVDRYIRKENNL